MSTPRNTSVNLGDLDRPTLTIFVALVVVGWLMIFAVTHNPETPYDFLDLSHLAGKQLFFIIVCFAMLFFIFLSDWAFWRTFAFFLYIGSIVVLIGPLFVGREVNGANAWYQFGGFSFQPSELAKFGTCLAMASFLSTPGSTLRLWRNRIIAIGLFMIPVLIILLEKDTGSALVFFSFLLVLYREGLPSWWYVLGLSTAGLVIAGLAFDPIHVIAALILLATGWLVSQMRDNRNWWLSLLVVAGLSFWWTKIGEALFEVSGDLPELQAWWPWLRIVPPLALFIPAFINRYLPKNVLVRRRLQVFMLILVGGAFLVKGANFACYSLLAPHQQVRIRVWLQPTTVADARGAAYNLLHSKMAIGSGGFSGKGYLQGNMTKLNYVPEQSTDFIFCTVGEEQGFLGVLGVVALFVLLLYRITILAERQRSNFSRVYAYSVAGIIFVHFIVNVGMTMGLFPIIGIPLPFISYGGSSLIGFTLMIGVLLKLDNHRNQA
jgi:rod shape determining protein RodA